MNNSYITLRELLEHPDVKDLLRPGDVERITTSMSNPNQTTKDPLYIRILSGIGAWFASIFLISFLGMSRIINSEAGALICGIAFIAGTVTLSKTCKSTFPGQLALAMAFAGNAMVVFGVTGMFHRHEIPAVVVSHGVICAIIYILYPSSIYRFFAPLALAILATIWITVELKTFEMMHILIAAETLLAGALLLHTRRTAFIQPLIHASAVMLPATILFMNLTQGNMFNWHIWRVDPSCPMGPSSALLAGGLIYLYFHIAGGVSQYRQPWLIAAVVATILLAIFTTPGILVAIGLLVAGYAFSDRALTALSYIFLPCFLVAFYYALNINLAHKSWIVAGSGIILLVLRWIAGRTAAKEVQE